MAIVIGIFLLVCAFLLTLSVGASVENGVSGRVSIIGSFLFAILLQTAGTYLIYSG
jgi:hypothetical protein